MSKHQRARAIAQGLTKGFINAYVCENLHSMVTINTDAGFIPSAVACPQCGAESHSMNYLVNQNLPPVVEWFKPSEGEMQATELTMNAEQAKIFRTHILKGGLMSREYKLPKLTS